MKFGLRPAEGNDRFAEALEQTVLAESLGFDSVWFGEHFGSGEYWWPSPLLILAGLAARTERILLGTNVLIGPLYQPVYLANAMAVLDRMSGGRAICGLGAGYEQKEFDAFGIPLQQRIGRLREMIALMRELWDKPVVDFTGRYFTVRDLPASIRPVAPEGVPVWLGGGGEKLLALAREAQCKWVAPPTATLQQLLDRYALYTGAPSANPPAPIALMREVVVDHTDAAAWERAVELLKPKYDQYQKNGHPLVRYKNMEEFREYLTSRVVVGSPDTCVQQLSRYLRALPVDHLILKLFTIGMSNAETQHKIRLAAAEVLPHLR